jgi:hypothetical protein
MDTGEHPKIYRWLLIGTTLFSYSFILAFSIVLYVNYASKSGCGNNVFFITFNLILTILSTIISVLPKVQEANPRSGIFQSGILGLYTTYLIGSAIAGQPNNIEFSCGPGPIGSNDDALATAMAIVGLIMCVPNLQFHACVPTDCVFFILKEMVSYFYV